MKAIFDGRDFFLILENGELKNIMTSKLEADLKDYFEEKSLDKRVSLEYNEKVKQPDGVEIKYLPQDKSWNDINRIVFYINNRAIQYLESPQRSIITRQITGDKIEIYNGMRPGFERY